MICNYNMGHYHPVQAQKLQSWRLLAWTVCLYHYLIGFPGKMFKSKHCIDLHPWACDPHVLPFLFYPMVLDSSTEVHLTTIYHPRDHVLSILASFYCRIADLQLIDSAEVHPFIHYCAHVSLLVLFQPLQIFSRYGFDSS